jgi:hypothetical protein|tara:strand:+ start:711 stop:1076 length:366 start_codon:yes stop_codon:yes gene_type:complete
MHQEVNDILESRVKTIPHTLKCFSDRLNEIREATQILYEEGVELKKKLSDMGFEISYARSDDNNGKIISVCHHWSKRNDMRDELEASSQYLEAVNKLRADLEGLVLCDTMKDVREKFGEIL